jgi:hypothetical protein
VPKQLRPLQSLAFMQSFAHEAIELLENCLYQNLLESLEIDRPLLQLFFHSKFELCQVVTNHSIQVLRVSLLGKMLEVNFASLFHSFDAGFLNSVQNFLASVLLQYQSLQYSQSAS